MLSTVTALTSLTHHCCLYPTGLSDYDTNWIGLEGLNVSPQEVARKSTSME